MSAGHDTITLTVIVSAITSVIVSVTTFIVTVRLGKDQGDRATHRALYQKLFEYFRDLKTALEGDRPKVWSDFPLKGNQYVPIVRQMAATGEASLLPDQLQAEFENLEFETLKAGSTYLRWIEKSYLPNLQALVSNNAPGSTSSITGRSYRSKSALALPRMTQEEITSLADDLTTRELGLGLDFAIERNRTNPVHLYPDRLADDVTLGTLMLDAWNLAQNDVEGREALRALNDSHRELSGCLARLTVRIRDPHPLRETILRALKDVTARG